MPIYLYKGLKTNQYYEIEQSFNDQALSTHPESGEPLKRIIRPGPVVFKGSGWYIKDHARKEDAKGSKPKASEKAGD